MRLHTSVCYNKNISPWKHVLSVRITCIERKKNEHSELSFRSSTCYYGSTKCTPVQFVPLFK